MGENDYEETHIKPDILEEDLSPHRTARPDTGPMERSINQVNLLGRVGTDPQQRGSGKNPDPGPDESIWTTRTDWHNIAVFKPGLRDQAYNYVVKGTRLHVTGRIIYGEVVDRAGIRRHTTTIAADDIIYLQRPRDR